jgi:hypothetical protein
MNDSWVFQKFNLYKKAMYQDLLHPNEGCQDGLPPS